MSDEIKLENQHYTEQAIPDLECMGCGVADEKLYAENNTGELFCLDCACEILKNDLLEIARKHKSKLLEMVIEDICFEVYIDEYFEEVSQDG